MASLNEQRALNYFRMMEQWREQARALYALNPLQRPSSISIDIPSIEAVLEYYDATEQRLREAVQTRPIRIEVHDTTDGVISLALDAERVAIMEILGGPHEAGKGLDSITLAWAIGKISARRTGPTTRTGD